MLAGFEFGAPRASQLACDSGRRPRQPSWRCHKALLEVGGTANILAC